MMFSIDLWHNGNTGIGFTLAILETGIYFKVFFELSSQFKVLGKELWNFDWSWDKDIQEREG